MPPYKCAARVAVTHETLVEIRSLVSLGYIDDAIDTLSSLLHQGLDKDIWNHMSLFTDTSEMGVKVRNGTLLAISGVTRKQAILNISGLLDKLSVEEISILRSLIEPFVEYYCNEGDKPSHSFVYDTITEAMYAYPQFPFNIIDILTNVVTYLSCQ